MDKETQFISTISTLYAVFRYCPPAYDGVQPANERESWKMQQEDNGTTVAPCGWTSDRLGEMHAAIDVRV